MDGYTLSENLYFFIPQLRVAIFSVVGMRYKFGAFDIGKLCRIEGYDFDKYRALTTDVVFFKQSTGERLELFPAREGVTPIVNGGGSWGPFARSLKYRRVSIHLCILGW